LRGRATATPEQVVVALEALDLICPALRPDRAEARLAADLAARYDLTIYDAAYASVAASRNATLATYDAALLRACLGHRPSELISRLQLPEG
jgi:predicted nucleic acid-binding protein